MLMGLHFVALCVAVIAGGLVSVLDAQATTVTPTRTYIDVSQDSVNATVYPAPALQRLVVTPTTIFVNDSTVNATVHIYPAPAYTQVFLQYRDYTDCTVPPSIADETVRTHVKQLDLMSQVSFRVAQLRPGLYWICYRNATAGVGYTGFRPLYARITISRSDECSGGRFGICRATPSTLNGRVGNSTIQLSYSPAGKQAFIMKPKRFGVALYNCSNPPPTESGMRSPTTTVMAESMITFETFGLVAGSYDICYKNNTLFERLSVTLVVSGPIDATRSTVSCCNGPYTVGQRSYCQINAVDSLGNPAGGPADACELRVCPLTDGRGDDVADFVDPYYVSTGLFEFYFTPEGSGCSASASASFKGLTLGGNKINFFTILPAVVDPSKATSDCSWSDGVTTCNVTRRDSFGNPVTTCHVSSSGGLVCVPTVEA